MTTTEGREILANIIKTKLTARPWLTRALSLDPEASEEMASMITELMAESSEAALETVKSSIDMMRGSVFATARGVR